MYVRPCGLTLDHEVGHAGGGRVQQQLDVVGALPLQPDLHDAGRLLRAPAAPARRASLPTGRPLRPRAPNGAAESAAQCAPHAAENVLRLGVQIVEDGLHLNGKRRAAANVLVANELQQRKGAAGTGAQAEGQQRRKSNSAVSHSKNGQK
jgi:hypothetical protein